MKKIMFTFVKTKERQLKHFKGERTDKQLYQKSDTKSVDLYCFHFNDNEKYVYPKINGKIYIILFYSTKRAKCWIYT